MDVMRDLATPLPVLVIAQMMGVSGRSGPCQALAEKLLYIGRGDDDRMKPLTEGMRGMIDYVSPLVDGALSIRAMISFRSWRAARSRAFSLAIRCW